MTFSVYVSQMPRRLLQATPAANLRHPQEVTLHNKRQRTSLLYEVAVSTQPKRPCGHTRLSPFGAACSSTATIVSTHRHCTSSRMAMGQSTRGKAMAGRPVAAVAR